MDQEVKIQNNITRNDIAGFEANLAKHPDALFGDSELCPLVHSFADGIYVREIFIPAGTVLTGKIHKHSHPNFLMKGEVDVVTEFGGTERLKAPLYMISKAGTKRIVRAHTDTVWVTVHSNVSNTGDLSKIEDYVIADSYEAYDKFIEAKSSSWNKISSFINKQFKKLSK